MSEHSRHDPVGSIGEEAAKLLSALQGWTREHASDYSRVAAGLGPAHISDGSAACKVCPLCQLIAMTRRINPDSVDEVGHAAGALLRALAGLVEATGKADRRHGSPVQKIDLAEDGERS